MIAPPANVARSYVAQHFLSGLDICLEDPKASVAKEPVYKSSRPMPIQLWAFMSQIPERSGSLVLRMFPSLYFNDMARHEILLQSLIERVKSTPVLDFGKHGQWKLKDLDLAYFAGERTDKVFDVMSYYEKI